MKYLLLSLLFGLSSLKALSQETTELSILAIDENWGKEIIQFPIDWAPNLKLTGFEELRFAPNWANPDNDAFWSLVMAWEINTTRDLTTEEIAQNFEAYFDGLMKPNHWATTFPRPNVLFLQDPGDHSKTNLIGKMKFFDGFHSGKVITTNIRVEKHFCKINNKTVIIFRISPKGFGHNIWQELLSATYINTCSE